MIFSSDCCRGRLSILPRHAEPFLAALPFSIIHFGSAANSKLVALPKKPCFLAGAVKNGGQSGGHRAGRSDNHLNSRVQT
jgi:hypothetical protein